MTTSALRPAGPPPGPAHPVPLLPMAADLAGGASLYSALGGDTSAAYPVVRVLHIGFVLAGVVAMLRSDVRASLSARR